MSERATGAGDASASRARGALVRRVVAASLTLLACGIIVLSVPVVLAVVVGVPTPSPFDAHTVFSERGLFDLVVLVVWVLWAVNVALLARATILQLRYRRPASRTPHYIHRLAVKLAGACLVVAGLLTGASLSAGAAPVRAPAVAASAASPLASGSPAAQPATTAAATDLPAPAPPATVTVEAGQSLWSIAQAVYGDGEDWQLLAGANLGRTMDDGLVFVDPNLIYPGWQLTVPSPAPATTALAGATTTAPVQPSPPATSPTAPASTIPSRPTASTHPAAADRATPRAQVPTNPSTGRDPTRPAEGSRPTVATHGGDPHRLYLPELVLLGLGTLCAAVLLRAVLRKRRLTRLGRRPGQATRPSTEEAGVLHATLTPFADAPALDLVERGLSHLTYALQGRQDDAPAIRLVRVGPDGLTLLLARPTGTAPGAFESSADGHAWLLPPTGDVAGLPGALDEDPWLPALVPAGESAEGTFLLPVEGGTVVPVAGSDAPGALTTMQAVAEGWSWSGDRLEVVTSPDDAQRAGELLGDPHETCDRARVLYFGDPAALNPDTLGRVGTITTEPVEPTDLSLVCDEGVTRIEPFGLTLVPARLAPQQAITLTELLTAAPPSPSTESRADGAFTGPGPADDGAVALGVVPRLPEPGPIEVRVLAPVPRIEGAAGTPPENRQARAVELLAYLALHGHPIPPYEVRAEALATRSGEGSAQTLRLVASGLRQWVGSEHLPHADRTGGYRAQTVTTDLGRLQAAVASAEAITDPDALIALLRPALALIEGKPVSRTTMGWGWWSAQFETQAADAASDAACILAPLLAERGDGRGARWAIDQARLLDPWSEALYRVAIGCGATTGNAAWIERELRACEAMIEDLCPGGSPSEETYEAYRSAMAQFVPG